METGVSSAGGDAARARGGGSSWAFAVNETALRGDVEITLLIQWRDRIAQYGRRAINGVTPWLADGRLAALAVRVIWRVGERGAPEETGQALRAARSRLPPALRADVDWPVASLRRQPQR
jgi:hypothetical protein